MPKEELHVINNIKDSFVKFLKDDPVRTELSSEFRLSPGREVFVLKNQNEPLAIVCVCYQDSIPIAVQELFGNEQGSIAVFYTIWSYQSGSGKPLLDAAKAYIKEHKPRVNRFITLSPKTETARKFHLKNGAVVLQENLDSTNFEYAR